MRFAKYEGAGNDFILLDLRNGGATPQSAEIARLCDRHFGIGADGLMTLAASAVSGCDCSMRYYNADGSPGEMCGNGGRCFALFAHHLGIGGDIKRFDSTDGIHEARMLRIDGLRSTVELGMIDVERIDRGDGYWFLDTGVPHYVEFTDDLEAVDVIGRGRRIRYDKRFAKGTNVNFVKVVGPGHIAVRTYERGVEDETLACGTGSTAGHPPRGPAFRHSVPHRRTRRTARHRLRRAETRHLHPHPPFGRGPQSIRRQLRYRQLSILNLFFLLRSMKTNKGFRDENHADELRKAKRLEPIHKSGKERHTIYRELDDEEDDAPARPKRESAFDYFDDEEN